MCTIGVVAFRNPDGELRVFGFKNADNPPVGYWHGRTGDSAGGFASLAFGLLPQAGVNAGLNKRGLLVISSFFGFEDPETAKEPNGYWRGDIRGKMQAEALARCGNADDALALMAERYGQAEGPTTGGSHLLADKDGRLLVFEHCRGETAWQDATSAGWAARSNQALGLFPEEQRSQRIEVTSDRQIRLRSAAKALAGLAGGTATDEEASQAIRRLLASHGPSGSGGDIGSVCAHGVPFGRSNAAVQHHTVSGLIWNVGTGEMTYTNGPPCRSPWSKLTFG